MARLYRHAVAILFGPVVGIPHVVLEATSAQFVSQIVFTIVASTRHHLIVLTEIRLSAERLVTCFGTLQDDIWQYGGALSNGHTEVFCSHLWSDPRRRQSDITVTCLSPMILTLVPSVVKGRFDHYYCAHRD